MPSTLTEYVAGFPLRNDESFLLASLDGWMDQVEEEFLAGARLHPLRATYLQSFRQAVRRERDFIARTGNRVMYFQVKTRFDRLVQEQLNAREAALLASMLLGPPRLAHDNEYLTPGVACTAGLVDGTGALSGTWHNRTTYSGNHANAVNYLAGGGGSGKLRVATVVPQANAAMIGRAKHGLAEVQVLGNARHAEDCWFAYHFDDFVKAVGVLPGIQALPRVAETGLWAQTQSTPRIEFLMSMPPCLRDDDQPQTGCANYFAELRAAVGDRIPIVLYCYRPFEAAQGKKQVFTIAANGARVAHPNLWAHA